jgi:hypothetical protein
VAPELTARPDHAMMPWPGASFTRGLLTCSLSAA